MSESVQHRNGPAHAEGKAQRPWRQVQPRSPLVQAGSAAERVDLARQAQRGVVTRLDRGLYLVAHAMPSSHYDLAAVAMRRPDLTICLHSALSYHGLTTSGSSEVWVGLKRGRHAPRWEWPTTRPIYLKDYTDGIDEVKIDGVPVRITTPERTVAECWRHQTDVGRDICLEGTREAVRRKLSPTDIISHAKRLGVGEIVSLTLEAMHG